MNSATQVPPAPPQRLPQLQPARFLKPKSQNLKPKNPESKFPNPIPKTSNHEFEFQSPKSLRGTSYCWAWCKHNFKTKKLAIFLETETALPYCIWSIKIVRIIWFGTTSVDIQGGFFFCPPPNLTKSQAHYKLLDLRNLGGGGAGSIYTGPGA